MTKDYYILKILANLLDDPSHKSTYGYQIKMLLDMLSLENSENLNKLSTKTLK